MGVCVQIHGTSRVRPGYLSSWYIPGYLSIMYDPRLFKESLIGVNPHVIILYILLIIIIINKILRVWYK